MNKLKQNYKEILKYVLVLALFFVLSRANIGEIISPFSYALFFALIWCNFKILPLSAVFLIGNLVNGITIENMIPVLTVIAVMNLANLIHNKIKKPLNMYLLCIYQLLSQIAFIVLTVVNNQSVVYCVVSIALGISFMLVSVNIFSALTTRGLNYKLTLDEGICAGIFLSVCGIGLASFNLLDYAVLKIFGTLTILFLTYTFTNLVGIIAGLSLGIGASFYFGNVTYVAVFSLQALTVVSFKNEKRVYSVIALILTEIVLCYYFKIYNSISIIQLLPTLLAGAVFLLLPKNLSNKVYNLFGSSKENIMLRSIVNRSREGICKRMTELSGVFLEMNCVFRNMVKGVMPKEEVVNMIVEELSRKVCGDCTDKNKCRRTYQTQTNLIFKKLVMIGFDKGKVTIVDVPSTLASSCGRINILLSTINTLLENYKEYATMINNTDSSRILIADELCGVSRLLLGLADETKRNVTFDYLKEEKIIEELSANNIIANEVIIYEQEKDKFFVSVLARNSDLQKDLCSPVNKVMNYKMIVDNISSSSCSGYSLVSLKPSPTFDVAYGSAGCSKYGEKVSGDTHTAIRLTSNKIMFALCDGMGSGVKAEKTSSLAISLIENFYKAGFDNDIILSSANKLLTLGESEAFSALDIIVVDLETAGVDLIKIGSPATITKQKGMTNEYIASSLPLGILDEMKPSIFTLNLSTGDFIVLASDGVVDSFSSIENYSNFVNNILTINPQEFAEIVLDKAIENDASAPKDDMTVVVARMFYA